MVESRRFRAFGLLSFGCWGVLGPGGLRSIYGFRVWGEGVLRLQASGFGVEECRV